MKLSLSILLFFSLEMSGQNVFNSIADFKNVSVPYPLTSKVLGYYTPQDGGGGDFVWIDTSTMDDNGGSIIRPNNLETAGQGRYKRVVTDDYVNVLWFGAKRGGLVDASAAINNAINSAAKAKTTWSINSYGSGRVIIPRGIYKMSSPIVIRTTVTLEGEGAGIFPYQEVQLRYDGNIRGIDIRASNDGFGARMVIVKNLYLRNFVAALSPLLEVWQL